MCGDLNAHHSWWNSNITTAKNAEKLVNWLDKYNFKLLNEPNLQTCYRSNTSVINLTLATKNLNNKLNLMWEISKKASGLNYAIIQFSVHIDNGNLVENPLYSN